MAITGAHVLLYTPEAEAVRAVLGDVLGFDGVDAGGGWLIFRLPPAEVGVHPSEAETHHELSFMCDDINGTIEQLSAKGIEFAGPPRDDGFGITASMVLPGGLQVMLYEPRHETAI